eukprot:TRINITY_DN3910_c0_g1_i4.p1 TRINITY_DN3910_c0_g1~~TRINITY_DN3910_c0_g1_i4.p1  ORF type:complete len:418 (-),score=64.99 TRINITY_DN3910_c0_g1_i4:137-1390(-)
MEWPPGQLFDENCHSINIWTPSIDPANLKGVFFWIYGGGLTVGGSSQLPYDAKNLVSDDVVVVSFNYRVNAFGFLATKDMKDAGKGVFGVLDQQLALRWCYNNIAAFGGDPSRITIAGQSAGGTSVAYFLLYSEMSWKYIYQAIIQSGAPLLERSTRATAFNSGRSFLQRAGCTNIDCMMNKTIEQLLLANASEVNHVLYPESVSFFKTLEKGKFHRVPLIFGNTENELKFLVYSMNQQPVPPQYYLQTIKEFSTTGYITNNQEILSKLVETFPCKVPDCRNLIASLVSDITFVCPTSLIGNYYTKYNLHAHAYTFDHAPSWINLPKSWGVPHASEIKFVFNTLPSAATLAEDDLARSMSTRWMHFSEYGKSWDEYNNDHKRFVFTTNSSVPNYIHNWKDVRCSKLLPVLELIEKLA